MTSSSVLKLFLTPEHNCSYLDGKSARSVFLDPAITISQELYVNLNNQGFRRSGKFLYKPRCEHCNACVSTRVIVDEFVPNRSQKRIKKRNVHLHVERLVSIDSDEVYALYEKYITQRHADGDMYPPSREQYRSFLVESLASTQYYGFYDEARLVSVCVIDVVDDGVSALYTFYDPEFDRQALGVNTILWQIERCQQLGLPYLYLGYWIRACNKMNYKMAYKPQQHLVGNEWRRVNISTAKPAP